MEIITDLWHLAFANLVQERAPPSFVVESEVRLTMDPQRADLLLIRRTGDARHEQARVLLWVWPRLAKVTVVEFKSPTRSSFRRGDLLRLWTYGSLYHAAHIDEVPLRSDITLLLVIPSIVPTLQKEIDAMGWRLAELGGGYRQIQGAVYDLYVAVTDEVAEAERDGFLQIFSHREVTDPAAAWWMRHWFTERRMKQKIEEIPGYDEMFQKMLAAFPPERRLAGLAPEQRLAGLAPEQRLAGLAPEQRLAGLTPEQQILALSDEVLRTFPDIYLQSLSPETQQAIRKRIGRPD